MQRTRSGQIIKAKIGYCLVLVGDAFQKALRGEERKGLYPHVEYSSTMHLHII